MTFSEEFSVGNKIEFAIKQSNVATMKNDADSWGKLLYVLEWIIGVKLRHADSMNFSMAYISFDDMAMLGNRYGAMQAAQMLFELTHELDDTLRKTDIVARNGTDFWVLMPHIESDSVVPRVSKIIAIAAENGLNVINHDISIFAIVGNDVLKQNDLDSPLRFLDYVKNNCNVVVSSAINEN